MLFFEPCHQVIQSVPLFASVFFAENLRALRERVRRKHGHGLFLPRKASQSFEDAFACDSAGSLPGPCAKPSQQHRSRRRAGPHPAFGKSSLTRSPSNFRRIPWNPRSRFLEHAYPSGFAGRLRRDGSPSIKRLPRRLVLFLKNIFLQFFDEAVEAGGCCFVGHMDLLQWQALAF